MIKGFCIMNEEGQELDAGINIEPVLLVDCTQSHRQRSLYDISI